MGKIYLLINSNKIKNKLLKVDKNLLINTKLIVNLTLNKTLDYMQDKNQGKPLEFGIITCN